MKKILRAILLATLTSAILLAGCSTGSKTTVPPVAQVGSPAPDFQLRNLDGQAVSLSDFQGKPILINFWATWCPPCREEMPYLQQAYEEWTGKGLILLAIDIAESPATVRDFLQANKLSLPVLLDTNKDVSQKYGIVAIPTTFFVDKDSIIREKVVGAFAGKQDIDNHLARIAP